MSKFRVNDRHVAFVNGIAAGMDDYKAYQQYMSPGNKAGKMTAAANACKLLKRPEIKELLANARKARNEAITEVATRNIGKEFTTVPLTLDEMDAFHYAVIQGLVEVEEVVPQYAYSEVLNEAGKVIKRQRTQTFVRVKRPPNIREKQFSLDYLHKRQGNYAPTKMLGAFGKVNDDSGELENVERYVMLSNGEKILL